MSKWWKWEWDRAEGSGTIQYDSVIRWRRGWVTLYRFESRLSTSWELYLPFNFFVGKTFNKL